MLAESHERLFNARILSQTKQCLKRVKKKKIPRIIQTSDCITVWESSFLMTCPIILLKTGPHPHSIVVLCLVLQLTLKVRLKFLFVMVISIENAICWFLLSWRTFMILGIVLILALHQWCIRTKFYLFFLYCYWVAIDIFHSKEIKTRTTSCVPYLV